MQKNNTFVNEIIIYDVHSTSSIHINNDNTADMLKIIEDKIDQEFNINLQTDIGEDVMSRLRNRFNAIVQEATKEHYIYVHLSRWDDEDLEMKLIGINLLPVDKSSKGIEIFYKITDPLLTFYDKGYKECYEELYRKLYKDLDSDYAMSFREKFIDVYEESRI